MHNYVKASSRRDFLRLSVTVAAGLTVPPLLSGCNGDGDNQPSGPAETFVQPMDIRAERGVLDVTLALSYLTTTLFNPTTGQDQLV